VNIRLSSRSGKLGQCAAIGANGFFALRLSPVNRITGNSLFRRFECLSAIDQSPLEGLEPDGNNCQPDSGIKAAKV
jgi:hypothetical protein